MGCGAGDGGSGGPENQGGGGLSIHLDGGIQLTQKDIKKIKRKGLE